MLVAERNFKAQELAGKRARGAVLCRAIYELVYVRQSLRDLKSEETRSPTKSLNYFAATLASLPAAKLAFVRSLWLASEGF